MTQRPQLVISPPWCAEVLKADGSLLRVMYCEFLVFGFEAVVSLASLASLTPFGTPPGNQSQSDSS